MFDPCFWCDKYKCQKTHGLEIAAYRTELHWRAVKDLQAVLTLAGKLRDYTSYKRGYGFRSRERFRLRPKPQYMFKDPELSIDEILALSPEQMGMEEQRLKGYYREFRKSMGKQRAWKAAKQAAARDGRPKPLLPTFNKHELRNIKRWQPRTPGI